jgi:hypothetical protein
MIKKNTPGNFRFFVVMVKNHPEKLSVRRMKTHVQHEIVYSRGVHFVPAMGKAERFFPEQIVEPVKLPDEKSIVFSVNKPAVLYVK